MFEQQPERRLILGQRSISLRHFLERKALGAQRSRVEPLLRDHVKHRLEIPPFGPTHESDRIIPPLVLIFRIISSRPVGAGYLEAEFLFVEVGAIKVEPCYPYEHDPPALAAHLRGLSHGIAELSGCGDDHTVDTASAAKRHSGCHRIDT